MRPTFVLPEAERWRSTVYAFVFGSVVVRLGASKDILRRRCQRTDSILSEKYRNPQSKKTTAWEAQGYRECFERHETGEVWAAIAETVVTRFGPVNVYLAVENMLLQEHRPQLNANPFR